MRYAILFAVLITSAFGVGLTRYVDNNSPGGNDGLSWATAWDHPTQITGVGAGDTVYISGGTTSKTYVFTGFWDVPNGSSGNQLIISNGRDAGHTGTVIFNASGASTTLTGLQWVKFDFYFGGTQHLQFTGNPTTGQVIYDDNVATGFSILGAIFNWACRIYDSRKGEFGYCIFNNEGRKLQGGPGWIAGLGRSDSSGYGLGSSIHHCTVNLFYRQTVDAGGNNGDDFCQNISNVDIYNTTVISTLVTGAAGDNHQDFFQMNGQYMRWWNNYMENASNYCIFGEFTGPTAGSQNWQIWNNVFNYSDPVLTAGPSQAIAIGNNAALPTQAVTYTNTYIFNNTFQGGNQAVALGSNSLSVMNNCRLQNNLRYNAGGINVKGSLTNGSVISNNVSASTNWFVNAAAGDFHITSNATGAIDQGTTSGGVFSAITTTDKDGASRGATWDIGAYEFAAAAGPGGVAFVGSPYTVGEGAGSLLVTVGRFNGTTGAIGVSYSTTGGTATAGTDYTTTSGTLSWPDGDGANKTFLVPITQDVTVEGNEGFTNTLSSPTGGATIIGSSTAAATIVDDEAPTVPLMSGLTFAANLGLIETPFSAAGAVVSQTVDTLPAAGGRARYRVTIPTTGAYSMTMIMDCADTGSDSIYLDWDVEPTDPTAIFDVGATTGAQTKTVTWRGTGGPATPQFSPNFWNLTAGEHILIIRGREPNAKFSSITVVAAPVTDTTAPTPNPPVWELAPIALNGTPGESRITMTVATCSDPSGPVEYFFDETTGGPGATDSGWQQSTAYTDDNLTPSTLYTYRVKARDSIGNETALSAVGQAMTNTVSSGGSTINVTNLIIEP